MSTVSFEMYFLTYFLSDISISGKSYCLDTSDIETKGFKGNMGSYWNYNALIIKCDFCCCQQQDHKTKGQTLERRERENTQE